MNLLPKDVLGMANRVGTIQTRSVINPILWLCGITTPSSVLGLLFSDSTPLLAIFSCLLFLPLCFAISAFVFFAIRDPDRLQSEEYRLKSEEIRVLSNRGEVVDPKELRSVDLDDFDMLLDDEVGK